MAGETRRLAEYSSQLRYEDLPQDVVERARDCVIDSVGAMLCGHGLPWSAIVIDQALGSHREGMSSIVGTFHRLAPVGAALANGVLAHSFELDCLRHPSAGVHPGSVIVPAAIAAVQATQGNGRDLITAIVAGVEVMFRIGRATKNRLEERGFHAPGLNGNFGAAIAVAHAFRLNPDQMMNALGIAGSMGGGLLEFARVKQGGMIKRLHLGRAAANGVLAADLAQRGFAAPSTILEGEFGFLSAYAPDPDIPQLTAELGSRYETLAICFKYYPCHINAHTAVTAIRDLQAERAIPPDAVAGIVVEGSHRMAHMHNITEPEDLMLAQYSIPFCAALTLYHDPREPSSFSEATLTDPEVRDLCRRVTVREAHDPALSGRACRVTVTLKDGSVRERTRIDFPGMPALPLRPAERDAKFKRLARRSGAAADDLLSLLRGLEKMTSLAPLH